MAYFHADIEVKGSGDEGPLLHAPSASGKRTLIILIRQPHLFMQPLAFDKGQTADTQSEGRRGGEKEGKGKGGEGRRRGGEGEKG